MAKNSRNHSKSLGIPAQLSRRLRRFPDRPQPLMVVKGGASRQWPTHARLALTSTGDMSVESESYFVIGSRDDGTKISAELNNL